MERLKNLLGAWIGLCAAALLLGAPAIARSEGPQTDAHARGHVFRSGVSVVALTVTVEETDGSYLTELGPDDFRVLDEGQPQEISFFGAGEVPIDLVLMLDTSASMRKRLPFAQRAATNFVRSLGPADRAAFMTFGTRSRVRLGFTLDREAIEAAIGAAYTEGETALHNAVYIALHEFGSLDANTDRDIRRRAIVVLSDGVDTASMLPFDAVMELARQMGVAIYTVSLRLGTEDLRLRQPASEADYEMRTLARETGAKSFFPTSLGDLEGVYESIARELAHQYSIGYVPPPPAEAGRFRRVSVQVDHPGARVRARTGYVPGG